MFWQLMANPVMIALPVALAFSITRYRLWDIDNLINRALVYGSLTAFIVLVYILIVGGLGALFQSGGNVLLSILATGIVAVLFNPLRERVQRLANRLLYGERDDPYAVLTRLGKNLEASAAPDVVLQNIVETIARSLKLPYAAILVQEQNRMHVNAAYGTSNAHAVALPLLYQHQTVGELCVAPRSADEIFTPAERRLLQDIAAPTGVVVHNVRLTADLQRSREQIVNAREEERRRLRRDLHDGLGPALASLAMQADSARDWTRSDPDRVEATLADVTAKAQAALQDIRRLVYDLRPPALDELGLIGALRQTAANMPDGLQIEVTAPEALPPLSAAVEVAAYRIAQEALHNVAKHAHATRVELSLHDNEGELVLEIRDNGKGFDTTREYPGHLGLRSMPERAAQIGGRFHIESAPGAGTTITVQLKK